MEKEKIFQFPGLIGRAFFFERGKNLTEIYKCYYRDLSITKSWAGLGRWGDVKEKVLHSSCFSGFHKNRIFPVLEPWYVENRN